MTIAYQIPPRPARVRAQRSAETRFADQLGQPGADLDPHVPRLAAGIPHDPAHLAAPLGGAGRASHIERVREGIKGQRAMAVIKAVSLSGNRTLSEQTQRQAARAIAAAIICSVSSGRVTID
jgi:hypothetical protein